MPLILAGAAFSFLHPIYANANQQSRALDQHRRDRDKSVGSISRTTGSDNERQVFLKKDLSYECISVMCWGLWGVWSTLFSSNEISAFYMGEGKNCKYGSEAADELWVVVTRLHRFNNRTLFLPHLTRSSMTDLKPNILCAELSCLPVIAMIGIKHVTWSVIFP